MLDADGCEEQAGGYGLGVDRKINQVDEDPEVRKGTISAGCPAGDYTVRASISDSGGGELASATATFSVAAPEPPASTDAALSGLALSGVTWPSIPTPPPTPPRSATTWRRPPSPPR